MGVAEWPLLFLEKYQLSSGWLLSSFKSFYPYPSVWWWCLRWNFFELSLLRLGFMGPFHTFGKLSDTGLFTVFCPPILFSLSEPSDAHIRLRTSDCAHQTVHIRLRTSGSESTSFLLILSPSHSWDWIIFIDLASSYITIANVQNIKFTNYTLHIGFGLPIWFYFYSFQCSCCSDKPRPRGGD